MSKSVCRRTLTITEEHLNDPSDVSIQVLSQNTRVCPLVQMTLEELPCLKKTGLNFEDQSGVVSSYPNLKKLTIYKCNELEILFIPSPDTHFGNLEDISIANCIKMREITGAGKQKMANDIVFHKLRYLQLSDLRGLTSFWGCSSEEANNHKVHLYLLRNE